ncbi:MAG: hypothetical protein ACJARN_001158 [Arenicella sp.]|jgi:hypothetical protein
MNMSRLAIYTFTSITIWLVSACTDSAYSNYQELAWKDFEPDVQRVGDHGASTGSLDLSEDWVRAAQQGKVALRPSFSSVEHR